MQVFIERARRITRGLGYSPLILRGGELSSIQISELLDATETLWFRQPRRDALTIKSLSPRIFPGDAFRRESAAKGVSTQPRSARDGFPPTCRWADARSSGASSGPPPTPRSRGLLVSVAVTSSCRMFANSSGTIRILEARKFTTGANVRVPIVW